MNIIKYKKSEEIINVISHSLGFILTLVLFLPIIIRAFNQGELTKFWAWTIYMISLSVMFLSSSLYHSMTNPLARTIFRAIDHGVIYLTIAGSYSPIILIGIKNTFSIIIFILVWILALSGIIMNVIAFSIGKEEKINKASMIIYISMGWISLLLFYWIIKYMGIIYITYLLLGGVFYTIGAIFYGKKNISYNHAIWHIFILFASFIMFYGNYLYLS